MAKLPAQPLTVTWNAQKVLRRPFRRLDAFDFGRALPEAWAAHAPALATQNTLYLAGRFCGIALSRATASAVQPDVRMVALHQNATPTFLHCDGFVLQVASNALTARFTLQDSALLLTQDSNLTTLLTEPTGWHIAAHDRKAAKQVAPTGAIYTGTPPLAGINHYPAAGQWHQFWPQFDLAVVSHNLAARGKALKTADGLFDLTGQPKPAAFAAKALFSTLSKGSTP